MKNIEPELTKELVREAFFRQKPLLVVDVGARGGFEDHWSFYQDQVKLIGFESDFLECEQLNKEIKGEEGERFMFLSQALGKRKEKRIFYITNNPGSSGCYEPLMSFWKRFPNEESLTVAKTSKVETVDLDSLFKDKRVDYVDFLKLDIEGGELDVLKGAKSFLEKSVLGVSLEVAFLPFHKGRPLFGEIDLFLRQAGFQLFNLEPCCHARKALPEPYVSLVPPASRRGQVLAGQVLYLRDAVSELESGRGDFWNEVRILKLATIMELFLLNDCAIELIQGAKERGCFSNLDTKLYLDLLVPGRRSYDDYFKHLETVKKRGYVDIFDLLKRVVRRSFLLKKLAYKIKEKI